MSIISTDFVVEFKPYLALPTAESVAELIEYIMNTNLLN